MEILKERPDIPTLIKVISQEEGLDDYVITNIEPNQKGEGNMGLIYIVTVEDKTAKKKLHLILKAAFTNPRTREDIPIEKAFLNEIYFYSEIYPTFKKIESDRGVLQDTKFFPKCYRTINELNKELLILENMKESHFQVFNKYEDLDHEHIRLIFQTYGRFHAYSFVLQNQKPERYAEIVGKIHNIYTEFLENPNGEIKRYLKNCSGSMKHFLTQDDDGTLKEKFGKYVGDGIVEQITEVVTAECDYSVILHGDCHSNNMIFKYQENGNRKKPVDMRLLDMQVIKVGSPVCDLSYCLYSGAPKKNLDNLEEYLRIYYDSLASFSREFGSDPEKLFPFEALKEHWKKYARFGLIMAYGMLRLKSENKDFVHGDEFDKEKLKEEDFMRRIRELLQHMLEVDAL